jgi:sortase (surface protein transpeptidase)
MYSGTLEPTGENILTLSTCTEDSDDYKRYVIQAVLVGTVDKITSNTNN